MGRCKRAVDRYAPGAHLVTQPPHADAHPQPSPLLPVYRAQLELWPSGPIEASDVPKHPGLVQWLALADAKQCAPLVETCLSQLLHDGGSTDAIHEALASPHLRQLMEELRPETKADIMLKMAGLPFGFQVLHGAW